MRESYLDRKKMEKSLMTFLLLFYDLRFGKSSSFAVMVTGMQSLKIKDYDSQVEYVRKAFTKEKSPSPYSQIFFLKKVNNNDLEIFE